MEFQYKNVLIWGYGISGRAVEKILVNKGCNYVILDERIKIDGGNYISKISKKNIRLFDLIVLSPGVDINKKEIVFAESIGIDVISEVEFGYMFLPPTTKVIAVTGTNGKTTAVELMYNLLKLAGKTVVELGNIGNPFSEVYGKNYEYVVAELSSFQLQKLKHFKADISVLLNIAPDHIDRHKTFENYIDAKLNIFNNQTKNDYAILNADDDIVKDLKISNVNRLYFSSNGEKVKYSICDNCIKKQNKKVLCLDDYKLSEVFLSDVLACFVICDILSIDTEVFCKLLNSYKFLPHRYEYVAKSNNVVYINDSKATNVHATNYALKKTKSNNVMLLLGGRNKDLDFKEIFNNHNNKIRKVIAFGECRKKIFSYRKKYKEIEFVMLKNLKTVMDEIHKYLTDIEVVLLSPACASFDEFSSYMERGDYFKKCIKNKRIENEKKESKD